MIVGIGNLGRALANYRGFGARGFRVVALVDADPELVGRRSASSRSSRSTTSTGSCAERKIAIGILATPAPRRAGGRRSPRRRRASRSILNFAPAVLHGARRRLDAQGRPRDRAADPVLLPTAARGRRRRRVPGPADDAAGRCPAPRGLPANLLVRGRRVVVVGAGRIAARKIEPLLDARRRGRGGRARRRRRGAGVGRRRAAARCASGEFEPGRSRRAPGSRSPPPTIPPSTRAVHAAGEAAPGVGQQCRRPGELLLYADVGGPPGRPRGRDRHRWAQSGAGRRTSGGRSKRRSALSTRPCSTCSPRPGKRCAPRGVRVKTPIGNGPSTPASWTWSAPAASHEAKELLNSCL